MTRLKYEFVENPAERITPGEYAELMAVAFGENTTRHEDTYNDKHLSNPFGPSYAGLVFNGEKLVGMNFFHRWQFSRDELVVNAVQSCDTAIHPSLWGQGLFTKIQNLCAEQLPKDAIRYGFPNEKSLPGFEKLGWIKDQKFRKTSAVLNWVSFLRLRLAQKNHDFITETRFENVVSDDLEAVEMFLSKSAGSTDWWETRRSVDLYNWRLSQDSRLNIGKIEREGKIVGLITYKVSKLRGSAHYKLCSIIDVAFDSQLTVPGALSSAVNNFLRNKNISEISYQTNLSRRKSKTTSQTFFRSSSLIFDPRFGWNEKLKLDQFLCNSSITTFDSDH